MKVYVVGGATNYTRFLTDFEITENLEEADVVLFTGGEDVTPSLYKCKKHPTTYSNWSRDKSERAIFNKINPKQLVVGICRGSQFLCVMNGGKLVQNCLNHAIYPTHPISNPNTGEVYEITSTHHQMQYPFTIDPHHYDLLFYSQGRRSPVYEGDKIDAALIEKNGEPEIVKYHVPGKPVCLAIQGHPEMIPTSPIAKYLNKYIHALVK